MTLPNQNETITLDAAAWTVRERFAAGSFGAVFKGTSESGGEVALKFIPIEPGSDRELNLAALEFPDHVIPVLDSGDANGHHVLVMPFADQSLEDYISALGGAPLAVDEATQIITQLAEGLAAIQDQLVHRDLKPANVLLHDGRWKLSDFGTSRASDAATASATHKLTGSRPYVSPERWREEHATIACDVYSLGVIAFELLTGERPFLGPDPEDYRHQHLHKDPPEMDGVPPGIRSLVVECLYKAPGARPSPLNLATRLAKAAERQSSGKRRSLQGANLSAVTARSERQRAEQQALTRAQRNAELLGAASIKWRGLVEAFCREVEDNASVAEISPNDAEVSIGLNSARVRLWSVTPTDFGIMGASNYLPFDVLGHTRVEVHVPQAGVSGWMGRSHSVWFCDPFVEGSYDWFEMAFMPSPMLHVSSETFTPESAMPVSEIAQQALFAGMGTHQLAWPITVVDNEEFIDRWIEWFGQAAQDQLRKPRSMPERQVVHNWRRA